MKVSPAGQIVIPPPLQDESGIYPGTEVEVQHENGALVVRRREPDEHVREFHEKLDAIRALHKGRVRTSAKTLEEVAGLSRGEQFVQLLADAGIGHMTTDEFMEMMRGPYEDLDPR
jgi:bifunctional DNA-binding transcriptional regulator/antitoxin component of YhaV-PrlF toxin-antitoxin module